MSLPALAEDPKGIESEMRKRLAKRPGDLDARYALARALSYQRHFNAAELEFAHLLKKSPNNPDYLLGMAQVGIWRGRPQEALIHLSRAKQIAPHYVDLWRAEIQATLSLGDHQGAQTIRDEARRKFPADDWFFAALDKPSDDSPVRPAKEAEAQLPVMEVVPKDMALATLSPASGFSALGLPSAQGRNQIEAGVSHEHLTKGLSAWRSQYLLGEHRGLHNTLLYGGFRETERYNKIDNEIHMGYGQPISSRLRFQIEMGASDTHHILPVRYGTTQFQFQPDVGWVIFGGWRRSEFSSGMTGVSNLGADKYFGNERVSYTLFSGGPDGAGSALGHRLQWAHSYGESSWAGIALNSGHETENTGSNGFLTSRVQGLFVSGRHSIGNGWSLAWEIGRVQQGDSYARSGGRIGLRHAF